MLLHDIARENRERKLRLGFAPPRAARELRLEREAEEDAVLRAEREARRQAKLARLEANALRLLRRILPSAQVQVRWIIASVAEHYGVEVHDILSSRRTHKVVFPRQVAMYLAKRLTRKSMPDIGRQFGGRDHTTILHAARKIERLVEADPELKRELDALADEIQARAR